MTDKLGGVHMPNEYLNFFPYNSVNILTKDFDSTSLMFVKNSLALFDITEAENNNKFISVEYFHSAKKWIYRFEEINDLFLNTNDYLLQKIVKRRLENIQKYDEMFLDAFKEYKTYVFAIINTSLRALSPRGKYDVLASHMEQCCSGLQTCMEKNKKPGGVTKCFTSIVAPCLADTCSFYQFDGDLSWDNKFGERTIKSIFPYIIA